MNIRRTLEERAAFRQLARELAQKKGSRYGQYTMEMQLLILELGNRTTQTELMRITAADRSEASRAIKKVPGVIIKSVSGSTNEVSLSKRGAAMAVKNRERLNDIMDAFSRHI